MLLEGLHVRIHLSLRCNVLLVLLRPDVLPHRTNVTAEGDTLADVALHFVAIGREVRHVRSQLI